VVDDDEDEEGKNNDESKESDGLWQEIQAESFGEAENKPLSTTVMKKRLINESKKSTDEKGYIR
jgi:hypothetical protein